MPSQNMEELLDGESTKELKNIITWLNYRNRIDVEHILNLPGENNSKHLRISKYSHMIELSQ